MVLPPTRLLVLGNLVIRTRSHAIHHFHFCQSRWHRPQDVHMGVYINDINHLLGSCAIYSIHYIPPLVIKPLLLSGTKTERTTSSCARAHGQTYSTHHGSRRGVAPRWTSESWCSPMGKTTPVPWKVRNAPSVSPPLAPGGPEASGFISASSALFQLKQWAAHSCGFCWKKTGQPWPYGFGVSVFHVPCPSHPLPWLVPLGFN